MAWRRRWWHPSRPVLVVLLPVAALLLCEYGLYYLALARCGSFPVPPPLPSGPGDTTEHDEGGDDLYLLVVADTHVLGPTGHWFDRARREWQMERAFQSVLSVLAPDAALVLGDATDEGKWTTFRQWEEDVARFRRLFRNESEETRLEVVVGNHDIGFHNRMSSSRIRRFETEFGESNRLFFVKDQPFVMLNSMAFEDECHLCQSAEDKLQQIVRQLKTGEADRLQRRPILLSHFPLFRRNQEFCSELDITHELVQKLSEFEGDELQDGVLRYSNIPHKDVVSREATNHLMSALNPAFVFSGHNHYHCLYQHPNGVPELTVSTFSWRNRADPSFVLATVHPTRRKGKRKRFGEHDDDGDGDEREAWARATEVEEEEEEGHEQDSLTPVTVEFTLGFTEEEADHDDRQRPREQIGADETTKEQHGGGEARGEEKRPPGQEREEEENGDEVVLEVEVYYKRCELPSETTIISVYVLSAVLWLATLVSLCCSYAHKTVGKAASRKMLKLV